MPRRLRIHVPGGFYHVTLRGNHQQPIFERDEDRWLLNLIVARALDRHDARLHAYCWMGNHLHLLLQVGVSHLGMPMRQIAAEFARAIQLRMATTGHFFERRYHATLIEATDGYPWSSHHAYLGERQVRRDQQLAELDR